VDAATDERCWAPVEEPVIYRVDATPDLALALGLPEHAPVFGVDRLLADPAGRRLFHRLYVPVAVAADVPALEADPFRTPADLYTVLAQAGHEPAWTETVRARMPSPDDAGALRIPAGTPMLVTRRATTGRHGRILALEETRLSAEDTQLAYRITGD
jgi:GntR family transcriptional regulator